MSGLDSDKLKWTANGRNMKWNREAAEKIEDDMKAVADEISAVENDIIEIKDELTDYQVLDLSAISADLNFLGLLQTVLTAALSAPSLGRLLYGGTTDRDIPVDTSIFTAIDYNKPFVIKFQFGGDVYFYNSNGINIDYSDDEAVVGGYISSRIEYYSNYSIGVAIFFNRIGEEDETLELIVTAEYFTGIN